jgi:PAS domain S-box-containing protein
MEKNGEFDRVIAKSLESMDEADLLKSLLWASEKMTDAMEIDELLQLIVEFTPKLINLNRCTIYLWDEEKREFIPRISHSPDRDERTAQVAAFYSMTIKAESLPELSARLINEKVPIIIKDAKSSSLLPDQFVDTFKIKSMLIVPLLCKGELTGVMTLDHIKKHHHFTPKEIRLAMSLATHAALAIKNAQLISRLRDEQARSDKIIDTMVEGLLVVSPEERVTMANPVMENLTGIPLKDMVGMSCRELFGGGIVRGGFNYCDEYCPIRDTSERPCTVRIEGRMQRQDNKSRWISSSCSPALDIDGNIQYIVVTLRNMTENLKMKQEISRLTNQLRKNKARRGGI